MNAAGCWTSCKAKGAEIWDRRIAPERNRWKKEVLLAVYVSGRVPDVLFRERTWKLFAPKEIRDDRDVLLARLSSLRQFNERTEESSSCFRHTGVARRRRGGGPRRGARNSTVF